MSNESNELYYLDSLELMELLDRIHNWDPQDMALRDEIYKRLVFAENNGVLEQ